MKKHLPALIALLSFCLCFGFIIWKLPSFEALSLERLPTPTVEAPFLRIPLLQHYRIEDEHMKMFKEKRTVIYGKGKMFESSSPHIEDEFVLP